MNSSIKQIHNLSRPGHDPEPGDVVEIECVGGFVCEVDPVARKASAVHQQFTMGTDGALDILHTRQKPNKNGTLPPADKPA